jgi:hypothetical protein
MKLFILPIEPIESRYSAEFYKYLPNQIQKFATKLKKEVEIIQIDGEITTSEVPTGNFLDWTGTSIYKSTQLAEVAKLLRSGNIPDAILITDAWNPNILQLKYMIDLLDLPTKLYGIWHAGSYDSSDILGFTIKNKDWSYSTEQAIYYALDTNFLTTNFHANLFTEILGVSGDRIIVTGLPMEYLKTAYSLESTEKENIVVFPHRLSSDKQPEIFKDIAKSLSSTGYEFILTQEHGLTKEQYHNLLSRSKFMFSCALHENLGISTYESALHNVIPLLPNRSAYAELYDSTFLYKSGFTYTLSNYKVYKNLLIDWIITKMEEYEANPSNIKTVLQHNLNAVVHSYFDGKSMYESILS